MPLYRGARYALLAGGGVCRSIVTLSGTSVSEGAAEGTAIGTLAVANGKGTYSFTIVADPDGKFEIGGDNSDELRTGAPLDYETATSH